MIARTWSGPVPTSKADAYHEYMLETGVRDLRETPGNCGVYMLRRDEGDRSVFTMISLWDNLDSIRAFAGDDVEKARYYPEDHGFLLEMSERVEHHRVLVSAARPGRPRRKLR